MSNTPIITILELKPYGCKNEEDKFSKLGEAKDIVNAHLSYWGYKPIEAKYCENGIFEFRYSSGVPNDLLNRIQGIIKENGAILAYEKLKEGDTISRQAAIDELVRWGKIPDYNDDERNVIACTIGMLSALPSAKPGIIRCEDRCHYPGEYTDCPMVGWAKNENDFCSKAEREKGKWIQNDNGTYSCSLCQSWIPEEQHHYARYCLYCGADMRSDDNRKMNELLELIKALSKDKNVYVTIHYYAPLDGYEIEMREYDYAHYAAYHVKKLIRISNLLSVKIPTNEFFVKVLNKMYEELKEGVKDERESREASEG